MCTGIEPGYTPTKLLNPKLTKGKIGKIDIGDFKFSARGSFKVSGYIHNHFIVKIKPRHCVVGFWFNRLFLDADCSPISVKFHNTIALRILHIITENHCPMRKFRSEERRVGKECRSRWS